MGKVVRYRSRRAEATISEIEAPLTMPAALQGFFDNPPLLEGENQAAYRELLNLAQQEIRPSDSFEWLRVRDLVNSTWEIERLCRVKPALLDAGRRAAVISLMAPVGDATRHDSKFHGAWDKAREFGEKWSNLKSRARVNVRLNKQGINSDSILAKSFAMQIESLEAAERMLINLETRRYNALKQIEDYRERRALKRQLLDRVIDGGSSDR